MRKKKILAALLLLAVGFSGFADMYFKGAIGYGFRDRAWRNTDGRYPFDTDSNLFVVVPTFGIAPWSGGGNAFLRGLSFEISLDLGFGNAEYSYRGYYYGNDFAFALVPRVMAVYTWRGRLLNPYGGVGVSVPILFVDEIGDWHPGYDSVKAGFNVNLMAGLGFAITPSLVPAIELDFGFGTGIRVDVRGGVIFRFGG